MNKYEAPKPFPMFPCNDGTKVWPGEEIPPVSNTGVTRERRIYRKDGPAIIDSDGRKTWYSGLEYKNQDPLGE